MASSNLNIQKQLQQKIQQIEKQTKVAANQTIWQTLQEIQPKAQERLREIIEEQFYKPRELDSRYNNGYYERTYQFRDSAIVKPTQGGGHYVMQAWFDTTNIKSKAPNSGRRNFWSYAYSWGAKDGLRGTPLDLGELQQLVDDWNEEYNIIESFQDWFEKEFPELFEKNFSVQLRKVLNYKTW